MQVSNNVGTLGSLYTVSYYGQNVTKGDTFVPLNVQSQPFCVGVAVDSLGNAILVGGDDQCEGCIFRTAAEEAAGIPYPNGYYDVRRLAPGGNGSTGMTVPARMYDVNSVTGVPNTARDCCIQLPTDPQPIPDSCVPDANCSPRYANAALSTARCYCIAHASVDGLAGHSVYRCGECVMCTLPLPLQN